MHIIQLGLGREILNLNRVIGISLRRDMLPIVTRSHCAVIRCDDPPPLCP